MAKIRKSKRFIYNLQAALKVRGIRETQAQEAYKKAIEVYEQELAKEEAKKEEIAVAYQTLHDKMASGHITDMGDITRRKYHLEILAGELEAQTKLREDAEKAREEAREKLVEAVKEKKILEKDKEKKRDKWKKMMDKEAAKFLDEITAVKYANISNKED